LILNKDGEVKPNIHNLILIFREAEKWRGVVAYDEFNARVVLRKDPPWGKAKIGEWLNDHHETMARAHLQTQGLSPTIGDVGKGIQAAAKHNIIHPVREYFESLRWDDVPRSDTWLIDYFHAQDSTKDKAYIRAIGKRWLIAMVARIYRPGCLVDTLPILEGPQGIFKSRALRLLAIKDEWYTDQLTKITDRDTAFEIAGVLIVEIAEMDTMRRVSEGAKKASFRNAMIAFVRPGADDFIWSKLEDIVQTNMYAAGPLSVKFAYFGAEGSRTSRPLMSTRWASDPEDMRALLDHARDHCVCGCYVHIEDVLAEALKEAKESPIQAVVIIGDRFSGNRDEALARARQLHAAGTRVFVFQEGIRKSAGDRALKA
jgi:hypothetical protein